MEYIGSYLLYTSILILAMICSYRIKQSESEGEERFFRILLFLVLWIPASLRYDIGTDYYKYVHIYNFIEEDDYTEIGFRTLCLLLNRLGADSFWLFTIVGALTYAPLCFGLSRNIMVGCTFLFVCGFYLSTYSTIRQTLSISFVLYASYQLIEGRNFRFIIWTTLAATFHLSALLLLLFYLLRHTAENPKMVLIYAGIAILLMLSANVVNMIFSNPIFLATSYGRYADSAYFTQEAQGTGLGLALKMILPIISLFWIRQVSERYENTGYLSLVCIACAASTYLASQIYVFNRLSDVFKFVPILCSGLLLSCVQSSVTKKMGIAFFIFIYTVLYIKDLYSGAQSLGIGGLGIMPYQSILEEMF